MAVITAAAIGAGAGILGDVMSSSSAQATNEQNMAIAQMNNQFNAQQAQLNRDFQAQQSDTQMQRRVQDLRLAGLNPALAYQQGGAQAMSGSTAQSAGLPQLQNPGAPFQSLGSQVTNAMQLSTQQAQIQALKSQADKQSADAAVTRAGLPYTGATAQMALSNLRMTNDSLFYQAQALERDYLLSQRTLPQLMEDDTFASKFKQLQMTQAELDVQRGQLGMPRLENDAMFQKAHPQISGWMQSGVPQVGIGAVGTAAKAASLLIP